MKDFGLRARLVADAYARNKYGETAKVVSCDNNDVYGTGFVPCYGISRGTPFEFMCGYKSVATGCKEKQARIKRAEYLNKLAADSALRGW